MLDQVRRAAGFLAVLIAPILLVLATAIGQPFLVVGVVFLGFPLMRSVFGTVGENAPTLWDERVERVLHFLPLIYALTLTLSVAVLLEHLARIKLDTADAIGWTTSLWLTLVFATCVAHELLHRKRKTARWIGHALAGLAGYPVLSYEHNRHHKLPGNSAAAE